MAYALLTEDLSAVQIYPVTIREARQNYPELRNVSLARPDPALYPRLVEIADVPRPATEFGETAVEGTPQNVAGTWQQTWTVQSITLAEAKLQLAAMAVEIYRDKVFAVTHQQASAAASGIVGAMQTRSTNLKPKYDDVITRIQAASTAAEARAILAELEAAAA
jgi:hypothetical protein